MIHDKIILSVDLNKLNKNYKMIRISLLFLLIVVLTKNIEAQTAVKNIDGKWSFVVDDKPFEVKGVTFGYDNDVDNYEKYFRELNYLGVNTIRTWGTGTNTQKMLDVAHTYGIKVMLGIKAKK